MRDAKKLCWNCHSTDFKVDTVNFPNTYTCRSCGATTTQSEMDKGCRRTKTGSKK